MMHTCIARASGLAASGTIAGAAGGVAGAAVEYALTPDSFNHANFLEEIGIGAAKGAVSGLLDASFDKIAQNVFGIAKSEKLIRNSGDEIFYSNFRTMTSVFTGAGTQVIEDALRGKAVTINSALAAGFIDVGKRAGLSTLAFGNIAGYQFSDDIRDLGRFGLELKSDFKGQLSALIGF